MICNDVHYTIMYKPIQILFLLFLVSGTAAQDLDQVLADHYAAAGYAQLDRVESMVTTGRNLYASTEYESSFTIYRVKPEKIRIRSEFRGSEVIQTYNGITGWVYAPAAGISEPEEITGAELRALLRQVDFESPLWQYEEKGNMLELMPSTDNDRSYRLQLTMTDGEVIQFFIDRESNLISSYRTSRIMGGSEAEIEVVFQGYERTRGIPLARSVVTRMNGEIVTTALIDRVELDRRLDPVLFEKPSVE